MFHNMFFGVNDLRVGGLRGAMGLFTGRRLPIPSSVLAEMKTLNESPNLDQLASHELLTSSIVSPEISGMVFGNDMLRTMILERVLFTNNGSISVANLETIRLVDKNWLQTACDSLCMASLPMFTLTLDADNSTTGCQFAERNGSELLNLFVRSVTAEGHVPDFAPPTKLVMKPEFFSNENHKSLSDCLLSCGQAIIEMDLSFPASSPMTFTFPSFSLPKLQRLCVRMTNVGLNHLPRAVRSDNVPHLMIYATQIILNSTEELKELTFSNSTDYVMSVRLQHMSLPETLTRISLDGQFNPSDLLLLDNNHLPNLTSLSLYAGRIVIPTQVINQILSKYRFSLKTLVLDGDHDRPRGEHNTVFRFPVMQKLEYVTISSNSWSLQEDQPVFNLDRQLPAMKKLRLLNVRRDMFAKWTENSVFSGVESVSVSLTTQSIFTDMPTNMSTRNLQTLHFAFPNIVSLEISMWGSQTNGLHYLFMEMVSLRELVINVLGFCDYSRLDLSIWDMIITGLSQSRVTNLSRIPEQWSRHVPSDENTGPSIRMLTALNSLALVDCETVTATTPSVTPLISDLSFHFGFLNMPILTKLLLRGRFLASPKMAALWKQQKGTQIHG